MIKNKEQNIIDNVMSKLSEIKIKTRTIDSNGNVQPAEVKLDLNSENVKVMKLSEKNTKDNYKGQTTNNDYNTEFQYSLSLIVETIVRETLAVIIKDTQISFKDRLDTLEEHFDMLVKALATVPQASVVMATYIAAYPESIRAALKLNETLQGNPLI